jgi:outer membrane protein assembly factor BamD (BamD/ComL family)
VKKRDGKEPPIHLPKEVETPEAKQLASDIYSLLNALSKHKGKLLGAAALLLIIGAAYLGYSFYQKNVEAKASFIVDKGIYYLNKGQEKKAYGYFKEAIEKYPDAPSSKVAAFLLGKGEKKPKLLGKLAKEEDFLNSPPAKTSLAAIQIDDKELLKAKETLSDMKRDRDWTYAEGLYEKILIALIEGNRQEAANYFSQLRGDFGNLPITAIAARLLK